MSDYPEIIVRIYNNLNHIMYETKPKSVKDEFMYNLHYISCNYSHELEILNDRKIEFSRMTFYNRYRYSW